MVYKLLLVKNRFTGKLKLKKGLEWFKKNTPIDVVVVDEIETDFDLSEGTKIGNATYKGVVVGEDIYPKLQGVVEEGKYHCVVFVYGNKLKGIRVNVAPFRPLYPGTDLIQLIHTNDDGKTLNHEILHTFFHRLQRQQIVVEDPMDLVEYNGKVYEYFRNGSLNSKPSNRSIALERIAPYWDKVTNIITFNMPYKYFKDSEVVGLKSELVSMLDRARELAGIPFVITSGYRDTETNEDVRGVKDSSHLKGLAVDLRARNSTEHYLITKALLDAGFKRISRKYPTHIHADIDITKPQNVLF